MGFLRLALAVIVLWGHTLPTNCNKLSLCAVEVFFVISGFYMELIKDKYPTTGEFYKSRFIRIFALYYVVLISTISFRLIAYKAHPFSDSYLRNFLVVFENLFIFGQDFTRGLFYYDGNISSKEVPGSIALYNPYLGQAWSIALELTFYLCVPFLLRLSAKKIIWITLASMWLRFNYLANYRGITGNWNCLFPGELCFFLMGSLACRFYQSKKSQPILQYFQKYSIAHAYIAMIIFFFIGLTEPFTIFSVDGVKATLTIPIYIPIVFAFALPVLFHLSKNNRFDTYIGNLSYGVYIWHMLVVEMLSFSGLNKDHAWYSFQLQTLFIGLALAIISYHLLEKKLDQYRHKRLHKLS